MKFIISLIKQLIINTKLRIQGNKIHPKSRISIKTKLIGNVNIGEYARIGSNVELNKNVIVGAFASINNVKVGAGSHIESGVKCTGYGKGEIIIGEESYIGINNVLDWSNNITIGNYVHIAGPSTGLWTHSSAKQCLAGISLLDKNPIYRSTAPIIIEDNVYIGGNCTIYPGVTIQHHSIVAPNSAVIKDVPPNTLVGGVPAKFIKKINLDEK